MSHKKNRAEFIEIMTREGMSEIGARRILRYGAIVQRLSVDACNRPLFDWEKQVGQRAQDRITLVCASLEGFTPHFCGDPRGSVTKIDVPSGYYNDMGGEWVMVPTPNTNN
jgi:hypothetical protein